MTGDATEVIERVQLGDTQPIPLQLATVAPPAAGCRHARTRPRGLVEPGAGRTVSRWYPTTLLGLALVCAALIGSGIGLTLPQPGGPDAGDVTRVPTAVVPTEAPRPSASSSTIDRSTAPRRTHSTNTPQRTAPNRTTSVAPTTPVTPRSTPRPSESTPPPATSTPPPVTTPPRVTSPGVRPGPTEGQG